MVTTRDCDEWIAVDRGEDHPNHEKAGVRLSLMAVVAAIFFGQAYLVRELFAAEVFSCLRF